MDCGKEISRGATRCNSCGQKGKTLSEEHKRKISEALKGENNPMWGKLGKKHSEETKRKISAAAKVQWASGLMDDPEIRRKMSESAKAARARGDFDGVYDSPETRRKKSEAAKASHARGDFNGVFDNPEYRHKLSGAMKARWARGDFDSVFDAPEYRRKHSEKIKAAWARGNFDNFPESIRAAWARGAYDGIFQSPTSIEIALAAALDICGIEHQGQFRPEGCRFTYDEFIHPTLLVEAHGTYWHGPQKPRVQKRDAEKAQWAKENGYHLVIIWEHEIKERGAWALVHERVLPLLTEGGQS